MRTHGQIDKWVRRLCGAKADTGASATVAPSARGVSVGPPTRAIPPPPPESRLSILRSSIPAARVLDARGFSHCGAHL